MSSIPDGAMLRRVLLVGGAGAQVEKLQSAARDARWNVVPAQDPRTAADLIGPGQFDAVIACDTGADRQALIRRCRKDHPAVACLAWGAPEPEHAGPVQWLADNTDAAQLFSRLERGLVLSQVLATPGVAGMELAFEQLPAVPRSYFELSRAVSKPDTKVHEIAAIVQDDPNMSLRVLRLVNSAYFGLARRITSISEAVALLGFDQLKALVLAGHVLGALEKVQSPFFDIDIFQQNSVRVGRLAKSFVAEPKQRELAFTAGLLHDVGKVVLALSQPGKFGESVERAAEGHVAEHVAEFEVFGTTHAVVGAQLLVAWEIPFSVVECVAHSHAPSRLPGPSPVLAAVHAADALVGIVGCGDPESALDAAFIERCGLSAKLPEWRKQVAEACEA